MNDADNLFQTSLTGGDPLLADLIDREKRRQGGKIIMIPSESICPAPVREALGSVFGNVYAEGYYPSLMEGETEDDLKDLAYQLVRYRRYADRRFYKGCEFANLVEYLAGRRAASLFATEKNPAEDILVNVQPLSGAMANNAVYDALVRPGDTVMGLSLMHGGHLTHGSEFNRSGKQYRIVSYEVSVETGRIDYDEISRLAREHRPKMIIAGYTSYPWAPDWRRFREICDDVGALLFADVSHPAGMIAAGVYPNPIDFADVTTCTTHKTLFGPRGAIILTTRREYADAVNQAVFPGEQGGPHVNKFAAMAAAFRIAATEPFRTVQRSILDNARHLGEVLVKNGLGLAYGGTDTHIVMVDLGSVETPSGYPLLGETAVRMLDLVGIVANKNTIPGDRVTAEARGVRLGTPWISQRGITREGIEELGGIIAEVLTSIHPFSYLGLTGTLPRGKIAREVLRGARKRVAGLVADLAKDDEARTAAGVKQGIPSPDRLPGDLLSIGGRAGDVDGGDGGPGDGASPDGAGRPGSDGFASFVIRGPRASLFLDRLTTAPLPEGEGPLPTLLLDRDATLLTAAVVKRLTGHVGDVVPPSAEGEDAYLLVTPAGGEADVFSWLDGCADGYVLFDDTDIFRKIDGPVAIERSDEPVSAGEMKYLLPSDAAPGTPADDLLRSHPDLFDPRKPYFAGKPVLQGAFDEAAGPTPGVGSGRKEDKSGSETGKPVSLRPVFSFPQKGDEAVPAEGTKKSCLYDEHVSLNATMVEFAGWSMPVRYGSIQEEHRAVREGAGLFDISHMGILEISGERAGAFLDMLCSNYVPWTEDGESQYGYLLDVDGGVIDDIMLYRRSDRRFIAVVNAVNTERDLAWLRSVNDGAVLLDRRDPRIEIPGRVEIRDLKDAESAGEDALVDIALQGPASLSLLKELLPGEGSRRRLERLEKNHFLPFTLSGHDALLSRTGYTGEELGFEIFVHPERARALWRALLKRGSGRVLPAGLGARDSLRIEAGLPLHGHELAGPYGISPVEAGFGPYVKLHKAFFVGRGPLVEHMGRSKRTLIRFRAVSRGVRIFKLHDHVVSRRTGQVIGNVTSSAIGTEGFQVGMACVDGGFSREGVQIGIIPAQRTDRTPALKTGGRFPLPVDATILSRFPEKDEPYLSPEEDT